VSANEKDAATFHGIDAILAGETPMPLCQEQSSAGRKAVSLPIGTAVTYWPGLREGDGIKSVTRSNVWDLGGTPVVLVRGHAGGIALTHIERRELSADEARAEALRAHVADLLSDVDHMGNCGPTGCDCLVGRLLWAINAEQVRPDGDPTKDAIDVIAREVTEQMLDPMDLGDLWSDYPEIGEDDWRDVVNRVRDRAEAAKPDAETYKIAYAHLQGRAEAWAEENDPA
jgi:hypothetical protein